MQTYYAKSVLVSKGVWLNVGLIVLAALALPEVTAIIPLHWMPTIGAIVGVIGILVRFQTTRPVAMIAPGESHAVEVKSL